MSTDRTAGERMNKAALLSGKLPVLCALFVFGLAGCAHKQVKVHIPALYPVELETMPSAENSEIEPVPEPDVAPLQWPEPPRPPVRRRPPAPTEAGPTTQPGNETVPEIAIGPLTTGGESNPQSQQQARELISSVDRRATALPTRITNAEKLLLRQVRNYLDQAKQALNTGDAEGATNLANKAMQLVDELERR